MALQWTGKLVGGLIGMVTLGPPGALLGETRFSFAELGSLSSVPDGYVVLAGTLHQVDVRHPRIHPHGHHEY